MNDPSIRSFALSLEKILEQDDEFINGNDAQRLGINVLSEAMLTLIYNFERISIFVSF